MAEEELEEGRKLPVAAPQDFTFVPGGTPTVACPPVAPSGYPPGGTFTPPSTRVHSHHAASPAESINSNGLVRGVSADWSPLMSAATDADISSPSYELNSQMALSVGHPKPLVESIRTPKPDPHRTLSFTSQTPLEQNSPSNPTSPQLVPNPASPNNLETHTPPFIRTIPRIPSANALDMQKLRRPPLPPLPKPTPGPQFSATSAHVGIRRTSSCAPVGFPDDKPSTFDERLEAVADPDRSSGGRRHSWEPSIDPPPERPPQVRRLSEGPSFGGVEVPPISAPLRRASTADPSLSPHMRSIATSNSPSGGSSSQYVPASRLQNRKSSWTENDFRSYDTDERSDISVRRASFPYGDGSADSEGGGLYRGSSGEARLKVKTFRGVDEARALPPASHRVDFLDGADFSPKTTEARMVSSANQLRIRGVFRKCRFAHMLGVFIGLLLLTSLLTLFWAGTRLGPAMAKSLRGGFGGLGGGSGQGLDKPPIQCVRETDGGPVACYVPADEREIKRRRSFGLPPRSRPMYERLLALAAHSLAESEGKADPPGVWAETPAENGTWEFCADQWGQDWLAPPREADSNGYLVVSAEGGLIQQRVAVCNAVALARYLNLTLVLPELVAQDGNSDGSQFDDIFDVDHFKEYLRPDVRIVDRLPEVLSAIDLAGRGSVFDDSDFPRDSPLRLFEETLLPVLRTNRVVHLRQFVNRLASDPIPPDLQSLRCRVNFHALRFQPRLQMVGRLLIDRMRAKSSEYDTFRSRSSNRWGDATSSETDGRARGAGQRALLSKAGKPSGLFGVEQNPEQQPGAIDGPSNGAGEKRAVENKTDGTRQVEARGVEARQLGAKGEGKWRAEETSGGRKRDVVPGIGSGGQAVTSGSRDWDLGPGNGNGNEAGTSGEGKRHLLAESNENDEDLSGLPEAVQRYMRNQKLRDRRKEKQLEESRRTGPALRNDKTLGVLERDEGMEVVRLETAHVIDDDSKGLAEKTRVTEAIGDEILVADPGRPGVRGAAKPRPAKPGKLLDVRYEEGERWPVRFVALHANFPARWAAFSMCDFGGGDREKEELRRLRETQFKDLARWERKGKAPDPLTQRKTGQCPLTPEEAVLVLAALGVKRRTRVYLTSAEVFGGAGRLVPLRVLYPYAVTKEQLASPKELAPFKESPSKLAALDFIVSSAADLFAMTDPGSQLSRLVTGARIYHGRGKLPTLRPDKRALAAALAEHKDVEWHVFAKKVRESVNASLEQLPRKEGQSIFRHPRSPGCMRFEAAAPIDAAAREPPAEISQTLKPAQTRPAEGSGGGALGDTSAADVDGMLEIERREEEDLTIVALQAKNSTDGIGTSALEVFEAEQAAVEQLPPVSSVGEIERD